MNSKGTVLSDIIGNLFQHTRLSAAAMCGRLRRMFTSPLTSLAAASLHTAEHFGFAMKHWAGVVAGQQSVDQVYAMSGVSLTDLLPAVSISGQIAACRR